MANEKNPERDPQRDPDRLPDSADPSGPCPRCGRASNFELQGQAPITYTGSTLYHGGSGQAQRDYNEQLTVFECSYCQQNIVVIEEKRVGGVREGSSGPITWHGIHWWPTPGTGYLGNNVPHKIADAYAEGVRCLSVNAPNGAVAMFRTAITYMVEDKGTPEAKSKGDLKGKIKQMVRDGGPLGNVGDWADHVRLYGNAGAHPDLFGDVTASEAKDVAALVHTMIELLYVIPSKVAQRRSERQR